MGMHCWKDRAEYFEETFGLYSEEHLQAWYVDPSATCMLEAGHEEDHDWTDDGLILVSFVDAESE